MKHSPALSAHVTTWPARGYFSRMHIYLGEMFPLSGNLAVAVLAALGISGFTATVQHVAAAVALAPVAGAAWNIFAVLLTLRLMDELKDKDIDRRLFPTRPLPSGRVLESDIRFSLILVAVLYVASNLHSLPSAASAIFVLAYALLMYKRFLAPALLKKSLGITLLTHTPIFLLTWLQAFITVAAISRIPISALAWRDIALFSVMLWMIVLGWELARKIRSREEESEYVTYSQILGRAGAVSAAWGAQTIAVGICIYLYFSFSPGVPYLILIVLGWLANVWAYSRFLLRPNTDTSRLKPYASLFAFAILTAQVYGFLLVRV